MSDAVLDILENATALIAKNPQFEILTVRKRASVLPLGGWRRSKFS